MMAMEMAEGYSEPLAPPKSRIRSSPETLIRLATPAEGSINPDCSGTFSSQGHNLIGRNDGCSGFTNGVNGDKVGSGASPINPLLGALANYGGPTQTHALIPGSPAIDAGNPLPPGGGGFACAGTDQRGVARPQGAACDIGAVEHRVGEITIFVYLPAILK